MSSITVKRKELPKILAPARNFFTPEQMFFRRKLKEVKSDADEKIDMSTLREDCKNEFDHLDQAVKDQYEAEARQPLIATSIKDYLNKNPSISYHGIANSINNWCSPVTIQRWITSREGFKIYAERVIPLLSKEQKMKHLSFAKRFLNNWNRGPGKYLLIHYDENWFWGHLARKTVKTFGKKIYNVILMDPQIT